MIAQLEYSKEAFQAAYQEQFLATFSHGPLTKGEIDREKAMSIIQLLNSSKTEGIFFDIHRLETVLEGGSCSALALLVAEVALGSLLGGDDETTLTEKVVLLVKALNHDATTGNKTCQAKRHLIRSVQAAMNTICVNREVVWRS